MSKHPSAEERNGILEEAEHYLESTSTPQADSHFQRTLKLVGLVRDLLAEREWRPIKAAKEGDDVILMDTTDGCVWRAVFTHKSYGLERYRWMPTPPTETGAKP